MKRTAVIGMLILVAAIALKLTATSPRTSSRHSRAASSPARSSSCKCMIAPTARCIRWKMWSSRKSPAARCSSAPASTRAKKTIGPSASRRHRLGLGECLLRHDQRTVRPENQTVQEPIEPILAAGARAQERLPVADDCRGGRLAGRLDLAALC